MLMLKKAKDSSEMKGISGKEFFVVVFLGAFLQHKL